MGAGILKSSPNFPHYHSKMAATSPPTSNSTKKKRHHNLSLMRMVLCFQRTVQSFIHRIAKPPRSVVTAALRSVRLSPHYDLGRLLGVPVFGDQTARPRYRRGEPATVLRVTFSKRDNNKTSNHPKNGRSSTGVGLCEDKWHTTSVRASCAEANDISVFFPSLLGSH